MKHLSRFFTGRTIIITGAVLLLVALASLAVGFAPLALQPPRIVQVTPADNTSDANPGAPLVIVFDQWMQPASVEQAITLEPPTTFTTQWQQNHLHIQPTERLRYGEDYRLTIDASARNIFGRTLREPLSVAFRTVPYVAVTDVVPEQGTADVDLHTPITVEFDMPIVSEEEIAAAAQNPDRARDLPQPLALTSAAAPEELIAGTGQWLSPTSFRFYPQDDLNIATTYQVTVDPAVTADGRAALEAPLNWSFTTDTALLAATRPADGAEEVAADQSIEVNLAPGVNSQSASANFSLVEIGSGTTVDGTILTNEDGFVFTPAAPLARGADYEAQLAPGILAESGALVNEQPQAWQFSVMGALDVDQVEPPASAAQVLTDTNRVSVRFNHPVVALTTADASANLPQPLTITPNVPGSGYWLDTSTYVWEPETALPPATEFMVQVSPDLRDQAGGTLDEPYSWSFHTITPQVLESTPASGDRYADPTGAIEIVFNQPMDSASLQQAISVLDNEAGTPVAGSISASGDTATFTPAEPLARDRFYRLVVSTQAQAAQSSATMLSEYDASFRAAPVPRLISTEPTDDAIAVNTNTDVELSFNTPMDWGNVWQNLTIDPAPSQVYTFSGEIKLHLGLALQPETDYRITIDADARDQYGTPLGEEQSMSFRTGELPPEMAFVGVHQLGAYNAYTTTRLLLRHTNIPSVDYTLYRLDTAQATRLLQDYDAWQRFPEDSVAPFREGELQLSSVRNQTRLDMLQLGQLDPGLYELQVRGSDDTFIHQMMAVSPYALTIKQSADEVFIWAVDMATGQPVANLALTAAVPGFDDSGAPTLHTFQLPPTSSEGISRAPLDRETGYSPVYIWGEAGNDFTFATSEWQDGISPWSFSLNADLNRSPWHLSVYTERPIYRPGQTVHLRGAARILDDERYTLPAADRQVSLSISDPRGNTVLDTELPLSEFGTFHTSLQLEPSVSLGAFQITAQIEDEAVSPWAGSFYGQFTVAEYRKPAFEVTVTPETPDLVQGDTLVMDIEASYFASGPVKQAPVTWRLIEEPLFFSSEAAPGYSFQHVEDAYEWYRQDYQNTFGGDLVAEGTATTDDQGRLTVRLPTDQGSTDGSRRLSLDVDVTDVDNQVIAARASVHVHAGDFYVGLRPERYVTPAGQPQQISLLTLGLDERPVSGKDLEVSIYQREWYSAREQGDDGQFYWTSRFTDTLVETRAATTDGQGRTSISFTPGEGGSYRVTAEGRDASGHTVKASAFTWSYGGSTFWGVDDTNRIDLIADKNSYEPGDTASILVPAPYADMQALLTIEQGSVLEHRLLTLPGTTELLDIPIRAEYAPNVYVSIVLVKPAEDGLLVPETRVGIINLPVSTRQQQLNVSVTPDQEQAGPRDEVTYTLRATDYQGNGVRGEFSLALVDRAVLTLADDPNPDFEEAFYTRRPLGVLTAQSLTALVDRVTVGLQPGDKGGGGGMPAPIEPRRNMLDTAYWNPSVVTDADGTAQVTVALPDNLTTWQMTARGLTVDTLVGETSSELVATRSLLVRPALPRFLTAGDRPIIQAVIHNNTASPIDASVTLDAGDLTLEDEAAQTIQVAAQDQAVVRWQAAVGANLPLEETTLRFQVEGDGLQDTVEEVLPIQRFMTPEVVASAGQVHDTPVIEALQFPAAQNGLPTEGTVNLELVPSLAAGVESGLDYLEHYPYACTEQTVSRFLPNAVTYRLFDQLGMADDDLEAALERNLSTGLQRLATLQNLDGGWGWWADDESQPYLTAYVVQGLIEARKAGAGINQQMLNDALDYLNTELDGTTLALHEESWRANARAYVLFVLAEAGEPDRGRTIALYDQHAQLDIYGRAYLLMTLEALGSEDERVRTLIGELLSSAVVQPTWAHWEEENADRWTMSSDTRTTALALQALVRSDPDSFIIPNAVRYLMSLRDAGHWRTTQETAITLIALAEYLATSGELEADYSYQAALDGRVLKAGDIHRDNLQDPIAIIIALTDLKLDETSQLLIERQAEGEQSGAGRLYYTLRVHSYKDASEVQPLERGMHMERAYMAVDPVTLEPTGEVVSSIRAGDVVQVQTTLRVDERMHYLVIEDMLPAGLEALDPNLETVTDAAQEATLSLMPEEERQRYEEARRVFFTRQEVRDNRVALFATTLPAGTYHYTYKARATTAGTFQTLPATAYQMYAPEVFGRSAGTRFVIQE